MIIKQLIDEDFVNYKKPSMFIGFPICNWKCEIDCGERVCQNSSLSTSPNINIDVKELCERYLNNDITSSIVCGGLEPFDSWDNLLDFITEIRKFTEDDIVIYTGYYRKEIENKINILRQYKNIIIKFGRYIPGCKHHFDPILGVNLASNNQFGAIINQDDNETMKYSRYIELDDITVGECLSIFENEGLTAVINDGKLVNFEENKDGSINN